jgi:RNA polymerase sigma-70 factor, ECF subfamily
VQSQGIPAADTEGMRSILVRAVACHCPAWLGSQAEDLVQTALLRMMERPTPEGTGPPRASYLWRVAFSVVIDEIRRRKRTQSYQTEAESRVGQTSPGPDLGAEIRDCLAQLPEARRLSVTLHLQGFRLSEVATALRWSEKRVENLIYRGLADMRRCLRGKESRNAG